MQSLLEVAPKSVGVEQIKPEETGDIPATIQKLEVGF